jgi:hypothetical protein
MTPERWQQIDRLLDAAIEHPMGDAVSEATITLVNTGTNAARTITTSKNGAFQLNQVPPGTYEVRAEAPGFKTIV